MKVRVITSFNDKTEGLINRPINEVFECSDERAKELMSLGMPRWLKMNSLRASLQKLKTITKHLRS